MGDDVKDARKRPAPEPAHRDDIKLERSPHRCPFCHADVAVDASDQVACRACLARHHGACWTEGSRCAACGARDALGAATAAPAARGRGPVVVALGALVLALVIGGLSVSLLPAARTYPVLDLTGAPAEVTARVRAQAEAGDPAAMNLLGFRLMTGEGCAVDEAEAYRWGLRSAESGHAEAMFGIAGLLEQGRGAPRDEAAAASWYRRAVAGGDTMAGPALERLLARRPDLR